MFRAFIVALFLILAGCTNTQSQSQSDLVKQYRLENQDKAGNIIEDFYFMFNKEEHPEFTIFNIRKNTKITLEGMPIYAVPNVSIRKDGYIYIFAMHEDFEVAKSPEVKEPTVTVYFYDAKMLAKPIVNNCRAEIKIANIAKLQARANTTIDNLQGYEVEEYFVQNDFQIPGMTCTDYKYRQG